MNAIRCNKCGNFVADNTPYCPYCGNPITVRPPQPQNNSNNNVLLVIIILLLALIVGVLAWLLWGDKIKEMFQAKEEPQEELVMPSNPPVADETEAAIPEIAAEDAVEVAEEVPVAAPVPVEREAPAAVAPPVVRNKVANGTYRLNGAIMHKQNYYIDMEIHVNGNRASGQYIVYNGENVYVRLSGTIDANGTMRLTEYKNGAPTGYYFTGRFNQATYSGKYKCTNRNLTMNFSASTY
ncbi:MAG: hypothetical protein J5637_06160 [Prevotella sp.]|nr:hypothetical protein [Prevotella sp.]